MNIAGKTLNNRIHIITGSFVFLLSLIIYFITVAPTTSFWDCGEFIACSYTLSVMHPPGSPLYLLIGRILSIIPFVGDIGLRINSFSVLVSAATILFTFLVIVQLIKRWRGDPQNTEDRIILYASAVFGALSFAFSDSFWFNAVEAEVYSSSMLFTSIVVWLALRWGRYSEKTSSMMLIFFIFYLFGLAAGIHLLNILAFPFVLLIVFFHDNSTARRLLLLLTVQVLVPIILYMIFYHFNPADLSRQEMLTHQTKAGSFLKWFGLIWAAACLIYIYFNDRTVFYYWWIIPLLIGVAYSMYLIIYIRANLNPPINENEPSTLAAMKYYLARKQYGEQSMLLTFLHRNADFWNYQINKMFNRYFAWQFIGKGINLDFRDRIVEIASFRGLYGIPFLVGLFGAIHHFFKDWKRALAVFVLFFLMGYAVIIYLNQPDPQPRERDYSYIGAFYTFALWVGIGMTGILEWISQSLKNRSSLKHAGLIVVALILFIAVPVNMFAFNFNSHDRSGNYVAWDYSYNILQSCEENAIIFTNGDNDTFPLWYLQEVVGIRKDVRVVNLSLLNTHWYIRQLQEREPKIDLRLENKNIENLYPMAWKTQKIKISVPENIKKNIQKKFDHSDSDTQKNYIEFTMKHTMGSGDVKGIRVQDLMIMRIIQVINWKRPIYFSLTVSNQNRINLDDYLRMDGIVFKILPYKVKYIEPEIISDCLFNIYKFRNLNNPDVFFNIRIKKLIQNYRTVFQQLAHYYINNDQKAKALDVVDKMQQMIPHEILPYSSELAALLVTNIYRNAGKDVNYRDYIKHVIPGSYVSGKEKKRIAGYYLNVLNDFERVDELLMPLLEDNPDDGQIYVTLVQSYLKNKKYDRGVEILEKWIARHPNDENAQKELTRIKILADNDISK